MRANPDPDPEYTFEGSPDENAVEYFKEMDVHDGNVFLWEGEPRTIVTWVDYGMWEDCVTITNPVVSHPQDSESGNWNITPASLYTGWKRGLVEPATLSAASVEPVSEKKPYAVFYADPVGPEVHFILRVEATSLEEAVRAAVEADESDPEPEFVDGKEFMVMYDLAEPMEFVRYDR